MAISILPTNTNYTVFDDSPSDTISNIIQGSPVKAYITLPRIEEIKIDDVQSFVKKKLAELIAEEILKNKLCEFTKELNVADDTTIYRARAFLTPDDQVRVMREKEHL